MADSRYRYEYKVDMDKEESLAAIGRYIAGQGNQAGTEALAEILGNIVENTMTNSTDNFEQFDPTTAYVVGDIVRKGGYIYKFTAPHEGEWSDDDVELTTIMDILGDEVIQTHLSSVESKDLTAEESEQAGFNESVIRNLWDKTHPTIKFIDMTVVFNATEGTSHESSVHTALFYSASKGKVYKASLQLYADGRLTYNVSEV